jgi:hypothetical protein
LLQCEKHPILPNATDLINRQLGLIRAETNTMSGFSGTIAEIRALKRFVSC